jgi:hypothetical protein
VNGTAMLTCAAAAVSTAMNSTEATFTRPVSARASVRVMLARVTTARANIV